MTMILKKNQNQNQIKPNHTANQCCFHPILVTCFWLFLVTKLRKYYVKVCLFFILSCPSCLANGKHHTENHATKVTKKPKTKLPKYVMSQAKSMYKHFLSDTIQFTFKDFFSWCVMFKSNFLRVENSLQNICYVLIVVIWGLKVSDQNVFMFTINLVFTDKTLLVAKFKWLIDVSTQPNNWE